MQLMCHTACECCDFAVKQGQKACADEAETVKDVLLNPGLK